MEFTEGLHVNKGKNSAKKKEVGLRVTCNKHIVYSL